MMTDDMEMGPYGRQQSYMSQRTAKAKERTLGKKIKSSVSDFFGLKEDPRLKDSWQNRRLNMAQRSRSMGRVKQEHLRPADTLDSVFESQPSHRIVDPLKKPERQDSQYSRQLSTASSGRRVLRNQPHKKTRKESVAKMAIDGISTLMGRQKKSKRKPNMHSRSFAPASLSSALEDGDKGPGTPGSVFDADSLVDEVFFDVATPTSPMVKDTPYAPPFEKYAPPGDLAPIMERPRATKEQDTGAARPPSHGWQVGRSRPQPAPSTPGIDTVDGPGMKRMMGNIVDKVFDMDNSDRHELGLGFIGRLLNRKRKSDKNLSKDVKKQMAELDDHRPYFTWWVTSVQVLVYIISVSVYGIAPIGFEETQVTGEVLTSNLAIEQVSYFEKDNFWIGPRQADLIHLGAKYSPCMRKDANVESALASDRAIERTTACCIRNDGAGCVQSLFSQCSPTLSTWQNFTGQSWEQGRYSGSVCGQDPRFCKRPASVKPHTWPDDITRWPICQDSQNASRDDRNLHMTCEVVGRPCCTGIQGECKITTREHCTFLRGYFHENASLCSQVSCMNEICGMISFLDPQKPDQFYRLWISLFLHAGLVQLVITVALQFLIMRDLEKLAGWLRICIIYLGSGVAGSLASAIFLPYHVEAGPSGSQFGLLACLFVEVIQSWQMLEKPWWAIGKLTILTLLLFIIGLLPMVDNYAHLIGFLFGFLLAFAFLPYITFGQFDRKRKLVSIIVSLVAAIGLFALLIVLFYVSPIYSCPYCHYFNCIPFTSKFCDTMEVKIGRSYNQ